MTSRNVRTPPGSLFDRSGRPGTSGTGTSSPAPLGQQYSRGSPKSSSSNLAPAPRFLAPPPFTFPTAGPPRNPSTQNTDTPVHGTTPGLTDRPNPLEIPVQNPSSDSTFSSFAPTPSNNLPAQPKNIYLVPPSLTSPPSGPTSASLSRPYTAPRPRTVSPARTVASQHSRSSSLPISRTVSAASTQQQRARSRISDPFVLDCPEVLGYGKGGNAGVGTPARTSIQEEAVSPRDWAVNF
ncbi:hypothetical protein W97_03071 [Coniosporium apollinis CBS 100218]|uniref:Uncharacterized protein n=1 Tax=Coniosporium apollinis (strain CBS 100218) TaxID=1168221 RepID=R7YPR6_CONA1|nr:uncharacterized protein W97_03071 [Coniosporium apollinis CBS 100218]EON63843.1 hypothetical protein W97_03071 [Coniosporium apollinis CBS 100218]